MTYFRMGNPHYHRRKVVSLSCSGWEGVGPTRYGRQTNWCRNQDRGSRIEPLVQTLTDAFGRSKVFMGFDRNAIGCGFGFRFYPSPFTLHPSLFYLML